MSDLILGVYDPDEYFIVTTDNILEPLGVQVISDTRYDLTPQTKDNVDNIAGMHGELDFGTSYGTRALELHVAIDEGQTPLQKHQLQREMAAYLDPTKGYKKLIFMDDPDVMYEVKYSGKISFEHKPTWFDFVIPFKVKPFIMSYVEHSLVGTGSIVNAGTFDCPIYIEIPGPATSPSISVGATVIAYGSAVAAGQSLVIKCGTEFGYQTAYISAITSVNAMPNITGDIDYMLPPGISVTVIPSISVTSVKWNDKWV